MKPLIKTLAAFATATLFTHAIATENTAAQSQSSAALTWNRIAREAIERAKPTQHQAIRLLANVSLAQYAALSESRDDASASGTVATASMRVIAELFPSQAAFAEARHHELQPRTNEAGQRVAQRVLAEARNDGFAAAWSGQAPQAAYAWRSLVNPPAPPAYPAIGAMRTFLIESGDSFRPAPAPAIGNARFVNDLAEVRRHTETPTAETTRMSKFYDMTTGTLAGGFWNEQAAALIEQHRIGELQAATLLVTMNAAMMDAIVACHDAKYAYWVPRPSQADPSIKPLIGVPNHPSYPSNHSCISTAATLVLAHFIPQARSRMEEVAIEAGLSRIVAGLHFRFDVEAGEDIGRKVAAAAIALHPQLLAKWKRGENIARQTAQD